MSLLADLLSKKNSSEPSGGKDIPPTLTRSHGLPAKVRSLKSRYAVISVITATTIALGVLAMSQFGGLVPYLTNKPVQVPQPSKQPVAATPAAPTLQSAAAPPAPPQGIEPEKPAVPAPENKHARKSPSTRVKIVRRRQPVRTDVKPQLAAVQSPRLAASSKSAPVAASAGKIDTAKRDALLYAARSAEQASDWRLALANYRKAQKIDPDNFVIMNNTSAALNNLGMFDDGAKEAKRALGKKPDYVPAMVNAAIAYSSKGNSQEALRLFSEAAIADPGNRSLVINLGILQERTGKLDDAQTTYRPLANDGDPLALQGMARVYERKGNRGEAVRTYRQIMGLPNASPALKKEVKSRILHLEEQ